VPVDSDGFIGLVEQALGDSTAGSEEAAGAARAALQTLGERLDRGEARTLASYLSPGVAPWIATTTPAEPFDADEFVRRVAEREQAPPATARTHARAVLDALAQAVPDDEWGDMVAELPRSFAPLLPRGPHIEVADIDTFLARVAERAGIDLETADRATDAVLETLAERIAGGEVEDLILRLPMELHLPLERGRASVRGQASPMRLDKFIETIAHREGVYFLDALEHARAVLQVLREAVGEQEFLDVMVQLPDDYLRVLAR
jgi:uncharacterized protein (DUF2267 family)